MKYLIAITHVDLTDVPPRRTPAKQFLVKCTKDELRPVVKRAKELFRRHGDGNDNHYEIQVTPVPSLEYNVLSNITDWLDGLQKAEGMTPYRTMQLDLTAINTGISLLQNVIDKKAQNGPASEAVYAAWNAYIDYVHLLLGERNLAPSDVDPAFLCRNADDENITEDKAIQFWRAYPTVPGPA